MKWHRDRLKVILDITKERGHNSITCRDHSTAKSLRWALYRQGEWSPSFTAKVEGPLLTLTYSREGILFMEIPQEPS